MTRHLPKQFERELSRLKKQVLELARHVEGALDKSLRSLALGDVAIAQEVMNHDYEINDRELEVEEECLKLLALYHPFATDLRFIVATLKLNNDLERIGDLAAKIAERSLVLIETHIDLAFDFNAMAGIAKEMLADSITALIDYDQGLAQKVLQRDDELDDLKAAMYTLITAKLTEQPQHSPVWLNYLSIARHLERIGDHATNIAEDVIYLISGEIVRHGG